MQGSQIFKTLVAGLLLLGAACTPSQYEEVAQIAPDGPYLNEAELKAAIAAAKTGDEGAYHNSAIMLLGQSKYEAAEELALEYSAFDKRVSADHLCELRDVYNLELKARSEALIQEQGGTC